MTVRTEQGTREVDVPAERQKQAVLTDAQTAELARLGSRIETLYQMPMDVEWTLADGRFSIVQARPITALPPAWTMPDPKALLRAQQPGRAHAQPGDAPVRHARPRTRQ